MSYAYDDDLGRGDLPRFEKKSAAERSGLAMASFILGVASFFVLWLGYLTGLLAFILGLAGLVRIAGSEGRLKGAGFAVTGIIFGIIAPILFSIGWLIWFGVGLLTSEVEKRLQNHPVLVEHVGTIPKGGFTIDLVATGEAKYSDVLVYKVRGSRATAHVIVQTDDDNELTWAKLKLPSGKEIDLIREGED
jgi:hypothetical protein